MIITISHIIINIIKITIMIITFISLHHPPELLVLRPAIGGDRAQVRT